MKRFLSIVLLTVLMVNLTGCASVKSVFQGKKEGPTIWGKTYTANTVPIPSEAFLNSESICRGLAPDGKRFLITDHTAPYLWDMETKEIIYLTPAGAKEEELMRLYGQNVVSGNPQDLSGLHGKDLVEAYFSAQAGFPMGPTAVTAYACYDNNDMMVNDSNGVIWLLDADTGKLYGAKEQYYLSAKGQKVLSQSGFAPNAKLLIEDLATGEQEIRNYAPMAGLNDGGTPISAAILPDDSICAVLRDVNLDMEKGEVCKCVVETPDGTVETYDLGRIFMNFEPDMILSTNGRQILLCSRNGWESILVDRDTGTVSILSFDGVIKATPLSECLDENGVLPKGYGRSVNSLMPVDRMSDGQTILIVTLDGMPLLFRPDTLEFILTPFIGGSMLTVSRVTGNHYNRFFCQAWDEDSKSYIELTVTD